MKLHVLSDLHTEFASFSPPDVRADIVVLAGDIGVGLAGVEWAASTFPTRPVIYVPGNHEYYGHDLALIEKLVERSPPNIHVLSDEGIVLDGVRFLGSTLWTDFNLYGEGNSWHALQQARRSILDFTKIDYGSYKFTPEQSVELHRLSRAWLESELNDSFNGPTVVVTHHLPAMMSVAKRFGNDLLNAAFASTLEDIIEKNSPELWIHGHTHVPCDYELFETRVICNPRGYPREANSDEFRADLVVNIS